MKVSVIIPFCDDEHTLGRAIESCLGQVVQFSEIILVGNNATERSIAIAAAYRERHPGQIILLHEARQGANFARNQGLQRASGDWIQFLDADDELLPNKTAHQLELIQRSVGVVQLILAAATVEVYTAGGGRFTYTKEIRQDIAEAMIMGQAGTTCSNLWQREQLLTLGGFDTGYRYIDDPLLVYKFIESGCAYIRDSTPLTRIHHDHRRESITRTHNTDKIKQTLHEAFYLFDLIEKWLQVNHPQEKSYYKLLGQQKYLILRNYHFLLYPDVAFLKEFAVQHRVKPNAMTALRSYYYYLSNRITMQGVLRYPEFCILALRNLHKLF